MHTKYYYKNNIQYSKFLEKQKKNTFKKYVDLINIYADKSKVLEVGCGTGIALEMLKSKKAYGIEVAETSISICKEKKLNCKLYDGKIIPFHNNYFEVVGSFNVLEHVEDPIQFLNEKFRVTKKGGYIVIGTPNFLAITNNYHRHTAGIKNKLFNLFTLFRKKFNNVANFGKMNTINRKNFLPDDDACNITNPYDILNWAKNKNLKLIYWSCSSINSSKIFIYIDKTKLFRALFGYVLVVLQK